MVETNIHNSSLLPNFFPYQSLDTFHCPKSVTFPPLFSMEQIQGKKAYQQGKDKGKMGTTSFRCQDKWQLESKVVTNWNILIKGEEKQVKNQGGGKFSRLENLQGRQN